MSEAVNHPKHYGGKDNPLEVINIINHLTFCRLAVVLMPPMCCYTLPLLRI
jgi:hypothetical protein